MSKVPEQQSLFPVEETLEQAHQKAKAKLPITTENELMAVLYMVENTVMHLVSNSR